LPGVLWLAFRSVVNDPKRSVLYVLTLALLVAVIAAPVAVANAYSRQLLTSIPGITSERAIIVNSSYTPGTAFIDYSITEKLRSMGFKDQVPQLLVYARVEKDNRSTSVFIRGIEDLGSFYRARGIRVNGSGAEDFPDVNVGVLLARRLGVGLGDVIRVSAGGQVWNLSVTGIIDCSCPFDDEVLMGLNELWKLRPDLENKLTLIEVVPKDGVDLEALKSMGVKIFFEKPFRKAASTAISETFQSIKSWTIPLYTVILAAAYFASSKISAESEGEVEVLRCIGASRGTAFRFVFSKSMLILGFAILLGLSLGTVSAQVAFRAISTTLSTNFYEAPFLTPRDVVQVVLLTLVSSAAGAIYPAYRASVRKLGEEAWLSTRP